MVDKMKCDEQIQKKYNISDDDMFDIFLYWKNDFIVKLDEIKAKAQLDLIEELDGLSSNQTFTSDVGDLTLWDWIGNKKEELSVK